MSKVVLPFARLAFNFAEIGVHRGRKHGFRVVFGFRTLQNLPFLHLASRVKSAYEGRAVPAHEGWPAQRAALAWLVDKGRDEIYALEPRGIEVRPTRFGSYYIADGHHRALALFILGDKDVRAVKI